MGDTKGLPSGVAGTCAACTEGTGGALCQQCAANNTVCTKCAAGKNGLTDGVCAACTAGGLNANCDNCNGNAAECAKCKDGYFLSGTQTEVAACSECEDGKGLSAAATPANTCEDGTVENCKTFSTTDKCTTCKTSFRKKSETECEACIEGCENCDPDVNTCTKCSSGYTLGTTDEKCTKAESSAAALVFSFVGLLAMLF